MKKICFVLSVLIFLFLVSGCYVPMLLSDTSTSSGGSLGRNNDKAARDAVLEWLPNSVRRYSSHVRDLSMDDVLWATDSKIDSNFVIVAFIYKKGNKANGETIANPDLFAYSYEHGIPVIIGFGRWNDVGFFSAPDYQKLRSEIREKYPEWYVR